MSKLFNLTIHIMLFTNNTWLKTALSKNTRKTMVLSYVASKHNEKYMFLKPTPLKSELTSFKT